MAIENISIWMWLTAIAPLVTILYLLVVRHWKVSTASFVGYFIAVLVAVTLFQTPGVPVVLLTAKGVWDALSILYVVVPALFLYQVSKEAGTFDVLRKGIEAYTPNDLFHILAFGWVFSSFLQGITGFGVPAVVTAPLLVAMRVKPVWAVAIPLIGHAWANTFGTLAVAWEALTAVTEMRNPAATAAVAAFMLLFANILGGATIAWLYGKMAAVREALPAILVIGAIHGLGQLLLAPFVPPLSNMLPGTMALGAVLWLGKTPWYRKPTMITESMIMATEREAEHAAEIQNQATRAAEEDEKHEMPVWIAMLPYLLLITLIMVVRLIPTVNALFSGVRFGLPFPQIETGLGVTIKAVDAYRPFAPLAHPGTFLLAAALISYLVFRQRGDIHSGRMSAIAAYTLQTGIPSAIAFLTLVPLSKVMEGSGQTMVLAQGIAGFAPGMVYAFFAPLVGVLGAFMTSSNLSSNILFGSLQESTASALGLSEEVILAAQTSAAAVGNSIAPGNVIMAASAVEISDQSGLIIRRNLTFVLLAIGMLGFISVIGTWLAVERVGITVN